MIISKPPQKACSHALVRVLAPHKTVATTFFDHDKLHKRLFTCPGENITTPQKHLLQLFLIIRDCSPALVRVEAGKSSLPAPRSCHLRIEPASWTSQSLSSWGPRRLTRLTAVKAPLQGGQADGESTRQLARCLSPRLLPGSLHCTVHSFALVGE